MPRARKKHPGWSYITGEKGANRVRAFVHPSGTLFAEYRRDGKRLRVSLGHSNKERAKAEADQLASELRRPDRTEPITLGKLFDMYVLEVTPGKSESSRAHDKLVRELACLVLGRSTRAADLTHRDAARYASERRRLGDLRCRSARSASNGGERNPIGTRIVASDLKLLKAVLSWGVGAGLLDRNPLQSFKVLEECAPSRPVFTQSHYQALLGVAGNFPWQFGCLLVLAHETGHRISALLSLRWSDIDLTGGRITWRAEADKIGHQHVTPITPAARAALEEARRTTLGIGNAPVVPSPANATLGIRRDLARDWLERAQKAAGLVPEHGRGWHAFRRKFASEMRHVGLRDLCDLGGWKEPMTVVKCYQRPNEEAMRAAQTTRRVFEG